MPRGLPTINNTAPGDPLGDDIGGLDRESPALVIAWSSAQPHRVGEIAFFPRVDETLYVGRGDLEPETRAAFFPQRPGEHLASTPLDGKSLSRKQIAVRTNGVVLSFEHLGRIPTLVNGKECTRGTLLPGDTVMFQGELLLLCVSRKRTMAPLRHVPQKALGPFGKADAFRMIGESPAAWALRDQLAVAAQATGHVLLLGESGTGKELAAGAIHGLSNRANRNCIKRNAATLPETLAAAELFGTGKDFPNQGVDVCPGLFEKADRGTLFFDEIGDLPLRVQPAFLTALDNGGYQRLGERVERHVDVRVIGATLLDPSHLRHDLLARFKTIVRIPPLDERREDIPLLIRHLLLTDAEGSPGVGQRFVQRDDQGQPTVRVDPRFVEMLLHLPLGSNVRELGTRLWEGMGTSPGDVVRAPPAVQIAGAKQAARAPEPTETTTSEADAAGGAYTVEQVLACLERERWRMAETAAALGLKDRHALTRLLKRMGIENPRRTTEKKRRTGS